MEHPQVDYLNNLHSHQQTHDRGLDSGPLRAGNPLLVPDCLARVQRLVQVHEAGKTLEFITGATCGFLELEELLPAPLDFLPAAHSAKFCPAMSLPSSPSALLYHYTTKMMAWICVCSLPMAGISSVFKLFTY